MKEILGVVGIVSPFIGIVHCCSNNSKLTSIIIIILLFMVPKYLELSKCSVTGTYSQNRSLKCKYSEYILSSMDGCDGGTLL